MANSFRSYVGLSDDDQALNTSGENSFSELSPNLLAGEVVIAEAQNVLMFAPVSEQKQGKSGTLSVTNFKLSFVTTEDYSRDEVLHQQNSLLGENEVCLSNVDVVYQVQGDKRRRLMPGSNVSGKVKGLYIICKNMKVMSFSFKFSPVGHGKMVTNALLHHAFPCRHHLLFAYDYREPYYCNYQHSISTFRSEQEWRNELARTCCSGWKISKANEAFKLSASLPRWLIVPDMLEEKELKNAAQHFQGGRPPIWTWGTKDGAALVRMADLLPTINNRTQENVMLENVRKSHPLKYVPHLLELNKELPTPRDVQWSFNKLRDLCAPDSVRQFWIQDNHFYSQLETTRWLHTISLCLAKSAEAASFLQRGSTVVLQEGEGRDMTCLVASLVQLLLDCHCRTVHGFQALIQKEWVSLGHPFSSRLGHVLRSSAEQSPVLLVFLDCVWQLLQQFPLDFEFTETYLTTLWDSAQISLFETFLFDCERDRKVASEDPQNPLLLRSVWDWDEQFSEARDITLFFNPLFSSSERTLQPRCGVSNLCLWSQCYFRWLPLLEIHGGGGVQTDIGSRFITTQLRAQGSATSIQYPNGLSVGVGSFFPFSHGLSQPGAGLLGSQLALNSSFLPGEVLLDSQSLLNAPD